MSAANKESTARLAALSSTIFNPMSVFLRPDPWQHGWGRRLSQHKLINLFSRTYPAASTTTPAATPAPGMGQRAIWMSHCLLQWGQGCTAPTHWGWLLLLQAAPSFPPSRCAWAGGDHSSQKVIPGEMLMPRLEGGGFHFTLGCLHGVRCMQEHLDLH